MGRVPSVMANTVFRGRASSRRIKNFEDAVIFVIDVEKCLKRLDGVSQELVARIALQEYTQAEAAELMQQGVRSVTRKYGEVLDRLTSIFLDAKLLIPEFPEICQEGDLL
jgi:DNA-directed RNA polymerase specialized sigma24 family protein